ncbi:radical SAM protein [Bacteroidia bacterium]|nr:radical SAM protein [Bacteroidia bacterium]GHV48385.1 radical SAM protein [Bacteroidia bacterium]
MPVRDYVYYDNTVSLCPVCLKRIDAKIIIRDGKVFMQKHCSEHGAYKVLLAADVDYYRNTRNYNKASDMPLLFNTEVEKGCPFDCGLCTDHEQHTCLCIVEVTDNCNLACPTCYAASSPQGLHRSLGEIERMLDIIVANEGEPAVVQISGGEPTLHPRFFEILDMAKSKPVKHLMVNTNGLRIAQEEGFAERLAAYMPDFELYLQFDSFRPEAIKKLRGADLLDMKMKALEILNKLNLSTTLVATLEQGLNDGEIGTLLDFAVKQKCVRGITFQPIQQAGRNHPDSLNHRLTLTEVRNGVLAQSGLFNENDIIPVPCHPDALAMGYALKLGEEVIPLTRYINPKELLSANSKNTIVYEQDTFLQNKLLEIFSAGISADRASGPVNSLLCCLPQVCAPGLQYDNLFRVIIMQFIDAYNFDVRAVKKSCVHIVSPDGRLIPFETMNLLYRNRQIN